MEGFGGFWSNYLSDMDVSLNPPLRNIVMQLSFFAKKKNVD